MENKLKAAKDKVKVATGNVKNIKVTHDTNDNQFSAPTSIRSVARFSERFKNIVVVMVYALFAGLSIYHVQSFAIANGAALGGSSAMFYLVAAVIFAMIAMSLNAFYIYYSSKVQNKMTTHRMIRHLISGGIPLLGVVLLIVGVFGKVDSTLADAGSSVNSGTNIFIYISAVAIVGSGGWAFVENFLQRKRFPRSFKISIWLGPGVLVALVGLILLTTQTSSPVIGDNTQQWGTLIFPGLILIAGCVLTLLGAALINRASDYENKLKKLIKYGYVTHILITSTILTCFLFTNTDFSILFKDTTGVIVLIVQVIVTVAMITYIGICSRLKKISKANPIHNKILLLSYVAFVNVLGILVIFEVPNSFSTPGNISTYSYMFLGLSALQTTIVALVAAFMAFVTIEYKGGTVFFMGMMQVILILFLITAIYIEKDVKNITNFMGRFVVLLIYASIMVIYLIFELYWIIHLFLGEKSDKKEIARAKAEMAKKEKEEKEVQNA